MTTHLAFPADGYSARWHTWDREHSEDLTLTWENEAWTATGKVGREKIDYVARLSPLWQIRQFILFRDMEEPDLWLGTDGRGRWGEVNGAHRPDLDGAFDISIPATPFSHTPLVRRLDLPVGERAELSVVEIDVETLGAITKLVTYTRLSASGWLMTSGEETVGFEVDRYGLVQDVDNHFRRTL